MLQLVASQLEKVDEEDGPQIIFVLRYLTQVRTRLYPESLRLPDVSELKFTVSPYDFAQNIIEHKRAIRTKKLSRMGYPEHRNLPMFDVSLLLIGDCELSRENRVRQIRNSRY